MISLQNKSLWHVLLLFTTILLISCTDSAPNVFSGNRTNVTCLAPDDFGYTKMSVNSQGYPVAGDTAGKYSQWLDIGTKYNGNNISIFAYGPDYISTSAWYPFLGGTATPFSTLQADLTSYPQCDTGIGDITEADIFSSNNTTISLFTCDYCNPDDPTAPAIKLTNIVTTVGQTLAPNVTRRFSCFFTQGAGAYLLTVPENAPNNAPNGSSSAPNMAMIKNPKKAIKGSTTTNLHPSSSAGSLYHTNGVSAGGFIGKIPDANFGDDLYVKILDYYYLDNSGSLELDIKSGDFTIGPIQKLLTFMMDKIDGFIMQNFQALVKEKSFIFMVRTVLTLYFCMLGALFAVGVVQFTQKELVSRMFKVILITVLLTGENSWYFFNNYFFAIFTKGFTEFTALVTGVFTGAQFKGDVAGSFSFFDQLLYLFFSPETTSKIWSLLFHKFVGIYMIPLIYYGIFIFVRVIAQTAVYYIMTYLIISMLIAMAPVFIVFILFNRTKPIFDAWINQLSSYLIQGIFYIAALSMMTIIILMEFFKVIGYRTCWVNIFSVLGEVIFAFFTPCYIGSKCPPYLSNYSSTDRIQNMNIPGWSYKQDPDGSYDYTQINEPYTATGMRSIDFPFLNTVQSSANHGELSDYALLSQLSNGEFGGIAHIGETLIFILVAVLGMKFMEIVPQMSKAVAGTPNQMSDVHGASQQAASNMKSAVGAINPIVRGVASAASRTRPGRYVTQLVTKAKQKLGDLNKKLSYNKNDKGIRKVGGAIFSATKNLVKAPISLFGHSMYAATTGKLHPKLKEALSDKDKNGEYKNPLKGAQVAIHKRVGQSVARLKSKFTPKFIEAMQRGSADFDKKWDRGVASIRSPLTSSFDKVMSRVEKLQAAASGESFLYKSRDPNATIEDLRYQKGLSGREINREGAEVDAFLSAIDRQIIISKQQGLPDKFAGCIGANNSIDYEKALKIYANDIHADQSAVPAALKKFAIIDDKPDNTKLVAASKAANDTKAEYTRVAAVEVEARNALQAAQSSGNSAAIARAEADLTEATSKTKQAFEASTKTYNAALAEGQNWRQEMARYEILRENHDGVRRDPAQSRFAKEKSELLREIKARKEAKKNDYF